MIADMFTVSQKEFAGATSLVRSISVVEAQVPSSPQCVKSHLRETLSIVE